MLLEEIRDRSVEAMEAMEQAGETAKEAVSSEPEKSTTCVVS